MEAAATSLEMPAAPKGFDLVNRGRFAGLGSKTFEFGVGQGRTAPSPEKTGATASARLFTDRASSTIHTP